MVIDMRSKSGFSLSETLMAVLLLTIIFTGAVGGMIVMSNSYKTISKKSHAFSLMSTTIIQLTSDLKNCVDVDVDSSNNVTSFYSTNRNFEASLVNGDNGIALKGTEGSSTSVGDVYVVTNTYTNIHTEMSGLKLENGLFKTTIQVIDDSDNVIMEEELVVKPYSKY